MNSGKVVIQAELDTKSFETQIAETEKYLRRLEKTYAQMLQGKSGLKQNEQAMSNLKLEIEKTTNKLVGLRQQQEKINAQGMSNIQSSLSNIGNSMQGIIGQVVRWGLAVFGIRTAYNLVRNAMETIASQDEQLSADIEYMKNVIAFMLEPVVRSIVDLMKQLMFYVGYIAKAWFGIDIYANASAKAMEAGAKSAKKTTKELNKQLAKFDEMNVLQKQSSGGSGDSGGVGTPSFDLSKAGEMEVPKWMQWIVDHKDTILSILAGLVAGLTAIKLGLTALQGFGIGAAVAGIVYSALKILEYMKDPTWESFGGIVEGIGIAILGLGIATGNLPAIIAGVAITLVGIVLKYWDEIEKFFDEKFQWLNDSIFDVRDVFGDVIGDIYEIFFRIFEDLWKSIKQYVKGIRQELDGIIMFIKGIFTKDWNVALNGLTKAFDGFCKAIGALWDILWGNIKKTSERIGTSIGNILYGSIKDTVNAVLWLVENRVNEAISMINGAIKIINKLPGVNVGRVSNLNIPRLAQGGIVNNPGPGVMMGSYIAGERGAEAVLPLTDDTLQRLANMIPITVNLTNTMNGRVLSREIVRTQNEQNFAFNR